MNFAPIGALALFGGAYFSSRRAAIAVPLLSLIAGDIFTGFHRLIPYVYAEFSRERRHRILAAPEKIRIAHWRSHSRRARFNFF